MKVLSPPALLLPKVPPYTVFANDMDLAGEQDHPRNRSQGNEEISLKPNYNVKERGSNMMKSPQKALQRNCLCRKAPNITKENEMVEMGRLQAKALWVDEKFPIAQISAIWDKLG